MAAYCENFSGIIILRDTDFRHPFHFLEKTFFPSVFSILEENFIKVYKLYWLSDGYNSRTFKKNLLSVIIRINPAVLGKMTSYLDF